MEIKILKVGLLHNSTSGYIPQRLEKAGTQIQVFGSQVSADGMNGSAKWGPPIQWNLIQTYKP